MNTEALAVLVKAAAAGSLSAAARWLGIPPILAARRLAGLEGELGVRLMHRSTRSISLTPEGQALVPYAEQILECEAAALATLHPSEEGATGLLRATAPTALGRRIIIPMLPALLAANPQLKIELQLTERMSDLVGEGFDVAVRVADLRETNMIAKRLGTSPRILCAAPEYLARRGAPKSVDDLTAFDCLAQLGTTHWTFMDGDRPRRVRIAPLLSCDTADGLHDACLLGLGIALHPKWMVQNDVLAGRLVALKLGAEPHAPALSALYPSSKMIAPKLRVFLDALSKALADVL